MGDLGRFSGAVEARSMSFGRGWRLPAISSFLQTGLSAGEDIRLLTSARLANMKGLGMMVVYSALA